MTPSQILIFVLPLCAAVLSNTDQSLAQEAKMTQEQSVSPQTFEERKEILERAKNVKAWPPKDTVVVVPLTVSECTWLGGTVAFWANCGTTFMKCVGASGREMCIDAIK